jgi:hypothetical protein
MSLFSWLLRNIYISNGNGSFPSYEDFLYHGLDLYLTWIKWVKHWVSYKKQELLTLVLPSKHPLPHQHLVLPSKHPLINISFFTSNTPSSTSRSTLQTPPHQHLVLPSKHPLINISFSPPNTPSSTSHSPLQTPPHLYNVLCWVVCFDGLRVVSCVKCYLRLRIVHPLFVSKVTRV